MGGDVFSAYMDAFTRIVTLGHAAVLPSTLWLLTALAIIAVVMIGLSLALTDGSAIPALVKMALTTGLVIFLARNLEPLADRVMASFTKLGLIAGGSNLAVVDFLGSPDAVMKIGDQAFYSIAALVKQSCEVSMAGCLGNFANFGMLFLAELLVAIIFFLIALAIFGTLIMFKLSVLASAAMIVLIVFPMFKDLGQLALTNVIRWGIQMMILAIITGVGQQVFTNVPVGDQPDITSVIGTTSAAGIFLGLVLASGRMATALTSGAILHGGALLAEGAGAAAVAGRVAGRAVAPALERITSGAATRAALEKPVP